MLQPNGSDSRLHKRRLWFFLVVVFIAAAAVFCNTLTMDFVFDDVPLIKGPSPVKSLVNIPGMFTSGVSEGTDFSDTPPYYRPLFNISLAIDYYFYGEEPFGYHLSNILLHGIVSVLVSLFAYLLLHSKWSSFVAGLFFALHPVHSDAVAYVAARNEMLCALFMMGAFCLYLLYRKHNSPHFLVIALILYLCSLLSKEMSATLPFLIGAYEWNVRRESMRKSFLMTLPWVAALAFYLVLRWIVLSEMTWESPPFSVRVNTSFGIMLTYLRLLVFPIDLKVFYDIPIQWEFVRAAVLVPLIVLILYFAALLYLWRKRQVLFFGTLWIIVVLLPVSGLPLFLSPALVAERYLYLPSIGLSLCLAAIINSWLQASSNGSDSLLAKNSKTMKLICTCLLVLLLVPQTMAHNSKWSSQQRFWSQVIEDAPEHPLGYFGMGNFLGRADHRKEMARMYQKALTLTLDRQREFALRYIQRDDIARAENELRLLQNTGFSNADVFNTLGVLLMKEGRSLDAVVQFQKAVDLQSTHSGYRRNLDMAVRASSRNINN